MMRRRSQATPQGPGPQAPSCDLSVRVQPRASRDEVTGWRGETLLLRLTAPPVEGAANAACQELVAGLLGIRRSEVQLVAGEESREERVGVFGLALDEIRAKIRERGGEGGGECTT